jgi:hypothetical protein
MAGRANIQRVIITDLVVSGTTAHAPLNKPFPNISVAWVKHPPGTADLKALRFFYPSTHDPEPLNTAQVEKFLASTLFGEDIEKASEPAIRLARTCLNARVVVERSPLTTITLAGLIGKATSSAIGTYLGAGIAGFDPVLMLATVPGGLLVVGSAMGIAKGLEAGLSQVVKAAIVRLFGPRKAAKKAAAKKKAVVKKASKKKAIKKKVGKKKAGKKKSDRK